MTHYTKFTQKTPDITRDLLIVKTYFGSIFMARYDYLENQFLIENPKGKYLPVEADKIEYWKLAK